MAQHVQDSEISDAVDLLKDNGFDGHAEVVTVLRYRAMVAERIEHLGSRPYERSDSRRDYADSFKDKTARVISPTSKITVPSRGILKKYFTICRLFFLYSNLRHNQTIKVGQY
jgi:hypothetical protein